METDLTKVNSIYMKQSSKFYWVIFLIMSEESQEHTLLCGRQAMENIWKGTRNYMKKFIMF